MALIDNVHVLHICQTATRFQLLHKWMVDHGPQNVATGIMVTLSVDTLLLSGNIIWSVVLDAFECM